MILFTIMIILTACENLEEIGSLATGQVILTEEDYRILTIEYFESRGFTCNISSNNCSQVTSLDVDEPGDITSTIRSYNLDTMEYEYSLLIVAGYGNIFEEDTINLKTGLVAVSNQYYDLFNGLYNFGVAQKTCSQGNLNIALINPLNFSLPTPNNHFVMKSLPLSQQWLA